MRINYVSGQHDRNKLLTVRCLSIQSREWNTGNDARIICLGTMGQRFWWTSRCVRVIEVKPLERRLINFFYWNRSSTIQDSCLTDFLNRILPLLTMHRCTCSTNSRDNSCCQFWRRNTFGSPFTSCYAFLGAPSTCWTNWKRASGPSVASGYVHEHYSKVDKTRNL